MLEVSESCIQTLSHFSISEKATSMRCALFILILLPCFISAQEEVLNLPEETDPVVLFTATGSIFDQARNGIVNELRDDFSISIVEINEKTLIEDIDTLFDNHNLPKAVVLIGNSAIRAYTRYSQSHKKKTESIQVVTILALDIQRAVSSFANVNGIAYETPLVTALVNFRRVINRPITKIGVLYRKPIKEFVEKNTRFCVKEKFEIIGIEIDEDTSKHSNEIAKALQNLLKSEKVEALWIANDNVLLKPELLGNVWLPALKKNKVPLIVGVEALVDPKLNFGTFAVIPDPVSLGEQAAEIIFDLKADNWEHSGIVIHPAISMYSVLNLKGATEIADKQNLKTYEVSKVLNGKK
jgi:hypothetical protein